MCLLHRHGAHADKLYFERRTRSRSAERSRSRRSAEQDRSRRSQGRHRDDGRGGDRERGSGDRRDRRSSHDDRRQPARRDDARANGVARVRPLLAFTCASDARLLCGFSGCRGVHADHATDCLKSFHFSQDGSRWDRRDGAQHSSHRARDSAARQHWRSRSRSADSREGSRHRQRARSTRSPDGGGPRRTLSEKAASRGTSAGATLQAPCLKHASL